MQTENKTPPTLDDIIIQLDALGVSIYKLRKDRDKLLEACEEAYDLLEELCDGAPDASLLSKRANNVTWMLQEAIAQAEGRAK